MVFECFRCPLWKRGTSAPRLTASPIPLGSRSKSKDDVLASLLPTASSPFVCHSPCLGIPKGSPYPSFSCFPVCQGQAALRGHTGRRQAPLCAARGAACCQEHRLAAGEGIALLLDPLVTWGSPLAQHAEVRRFSGGAGAWVSSRRSRGIAGRGSEWPRSCWKLSSLLGRSSRDRAGDLVPHEPGLHCTPLCGLFLPLPPFPAPGRVHAWPWELSRAGGDGGIQACLLQLPSESDFYFFFFPPR